MVEIWMDGQTPRRTGKYMVLVSVRDARGGAFRPRGGAGQGKGESLQGGALQGKNSRGGAWRGKKVRKLTDL